MAVLINSKEILDVIHNKLPNITFDQNRSKLLSTPQQLSEIFGITDYNITNNRGIRYLEHIPAATAEKRVLSEEDFKLLSISELEKRFNIEYCPFYRAGREYLEYLLTHAAGNNPLAFGSITLTRQRYIHDNNNNSFCFGFFLDIT